MRNIAFQRLKFYTVVATYGWLTAIASSSAVQAVPSIYFLPPGLDPVQNQRANNNNNQQLGGRRRNQQRQQAAAPAPAKGQGRRRN